MLSILSRWLIQFCLYLSLASCIPEISSSLLWLRFLFYPVFKYYVIQIISSHIKGVKKVRIILCCLLTAEFWMNIYDDLVTRESFGLTVVRLLTSILWPSCPHVSHLSTGAHLRVGPAADEQTHSAARHCVFIKLRPSPETYLHYAFIKKHPSLLEHCHCGTKSSKPGCSLHHALSFQPAVPGAHVTRDSAPLAVKIFLMKQYLLNIRLSGTGSINL